jgi:GAF domain-containing protein
LRLEQYPTYLAAIRGGAPMAIHDTQSDERTRELVAPGAVRHDVTAQFDIPVRAGGRVVAVLTAEHVGGPRRWSAQEQSFATSGASVFAVAISAAERPRKEEPPAQKPKI